MKILQQPGVPAFDAISLAGKQHDYALLIPVINEGNRIAKELCRAKRSGVMDCVDVVICDGGSTDGSVDLERLRRFSVNTLLIKEGAGKQGAQYRMGIWWAMQRGYQGVVTIDGNHKDSIEDVPQFLEKLRQGYDFVQGSRFISGGKGIRTPLVRDFAIRWLHAPVISWTAHHRFTDTTNAFRGYSMRYLTDARVQPLRDVFQTYELLAYLSVRATQIGLRACEIPVTRTYPVGGAVPTKISFLKGNALLLKILLQNACGSYQP